MLLIFRSRKTKLLPAELVSFPKMAAWLATVIFILSCPLNPLVNYLDPTNEHKSKVTQQRRLQKPALVVLWKQLPE